MRNFGFVRLACIVATFWAVGATALPAQTLTTLVNFAGRDGAYPGLESLAQGTDGNFYGTTNDGGMLNVGCPYGCGTFFRITPDGTLATLPATPPDGYTLESGVSLGQGGNFLGTSYAGGANNGGTVFEITPMGKPTILYNFCSQTNCFDGRFPTAGVVQGVDGSYYGTTGQGGSVGACGFGCGTVFKITPTGTFVTLYSFCSQSNCTDGYFPNGLVRGSDGNFYGTTLEGGIYSNLCYGTCGTAFKITPAGVFTTLHSFDGSDGDAPLGQLVQAGDGNFYGTTTGGGGECGCGSGTVFQMTPEGAVTTLYSFTSIDGAAPHGALIQATDGNLYGTADAGGTSGQGTIFEITTQGALTTLHNFDGVDGSYPVGGLTQGTGGLLYGTTNEGGGPACKQVGCGTVFSLDVGLGPFVESNPGFGKVGREIGILGNDLTGTTVVSFNGTPATAFTVVSSTLIRATVPTGASTGMIQVTTPSGTLSSNVAFQVLP